MPQIAEDTVLIQLGASSLLTEHELSAAIAKKTNRRVVEIQATIGKLLMKMKAEGLIWAGQLFNQNGQFMWAATLTTEGKKRVQDAAV